MFFRSIPLLHFQQPQEDVITRKAIQYTEQFLSAVSGSSLELSSCQEKQKLFVNTSIQPFASLNSSNGACFHPNVEYSLSIIVNMLAEILGIQSSKYLVYGCCEALYHLSDVYATTVYIKGWDCISPKTLLKKSHKKSGSRLDISESNITSDMMPSSVSNALLSLALPLLSSSPISLDLSTHRHLILLAGNLASGLAFCNFKPSDRSLEKLQHVQGQADRTAVNACYQSIEHICSYYRRHTVDADKYKNGITVFDVYANIVSKEESRA